ncbi:two-component sensor histidine kinase BarA [Pseudoalteromonas tunicata]|uniref:histidine kinase n=1 Tax=Pseudoalteromonas tunicata D2 TaxID=87626 RepID=A4C6K6_9GAMM|nr:two-component sensor histidine kinase BarA [Pseudoalteromonas tunicata]ATC95584.1 two-component system, NarL family, sensor histidine kinase BarA [Pseudoalteromonas tunicata]AXT31154.1 two-component sensor histidine kinase BarA [Pseudoalteromonas tunicata]EAR29610.1 sensor protein barA [Pseudoalteromonas tunicata D2]
MTKLGLRDWILVLASVPTLLIGLLLGGYFTLNRYLDLNDFLLDQGITIIEPLAIATEQPLAERNKKLLNRLVSQSHNKHAPLIKSIAIFDANKELLITSNYHKDFHLLTPFNVVPNQGLTSKETDNHLVLSLPILDHNNLDNGLLLTAEQTLLGYIVLELNQNQALVGQQKALLVSGFIILLAFFISILMALRFSKLFLTPMSKLLFAIDKLKEGDQDTSINEPMRGEFELLRQGLNSIAHNMMLQKDEMQKHIDQAISDYRETLEQYETQNIQLNIAKKEAQDANRVKSDFLAKMSHELRTPLNGVVGFTRQLYKTPLNKHQKDYLDTIELSANSLLAIINDILDFSKLEAGAMELESIHFQLRDTVNEVLTLLAPSAHDKNLELSINIHDNVPDSLIGDPTRFKQILINLISNAIKFTESGHVLIDVDCRHYANQRTSIFVAINDSGIGISANKQDALFSAFGQADSSITRKFGGTGLGLIITKHLVEAMGGHISLNSAVGKGSCFTFNAFFEQPKRHYSDNLPTTPLEQKRVLYFETHHHTHEATQSLLQSWNMHVTACLSLAELEQALTGEFSFDIAILGHAASLDNMSEIKSLVNRVRPQCDYLYLMVNTVSHNMREAFIGTGADACLSKPLNHRKLCESLAAPYRLDHPSIQTPEQAQRILPIKVLVVDDNDANLKLMCTLLAEQIEFIDTAHNGSQALSLAKTHKYDLIFLDIQMPIMDGVTACKLIIESSINESTPIIAVTAHALAGEKENLLKVGFKNYLTKPLDEEVLRQTIFEYSPDFGKSKTLIAQPIESKPVVAPFDSKRIDWPLALQRAGGKVELAHEMLNMLLLSVPETLAELRDATELEDKQRVLNIVHKFHGACCYTGVPKLKQLAETIETALKQDQSLSQIEPELFELDDELVNLMIDAQAQIATPA